MKKSKGFTLIELLVVVAIIALLISILLPSLSRARELAKRAVCGANERGIGQGMHIYSNDNDGWFPIHFFNPGNQPALTGTAPATSQVEYVGQMGKTALNISEATGRSTSTRASHPSRSLFLLVGGGQSTTGSFLCPSSNDSEDDLRNHGDDCTNGGDCAAQPGRNRYDFKGYPWLSYGYQVPFGKRGKPKVDRDVRMPLLADKGPYYQADGNKSDNDTQTTPDRRNDSVQIPTQVDGGTNQQDIIRASNDAWRPYNSRNHGGEGQEVLFSDGHVKFFKKPIIGVNNDNIYTATDGFDTLNHLLGAVSDGDMYTPGTNTDSYLVP